MKTWRACKRCNGSGEHREYQKLADGTWGFASAECSACLGFGALPAPDMSALVGAIRTRKGSVLKTFPGKRYNRWAENWADRIHALRVYYVWRLYRFHAGLDVRMPVQAEWGNPDPYTPELDLLARTIAAHIHGHRSVGLARWRGALTGDYPSSSAGLPISAYSGGPDCLR